MNNIDIKMRIIIFTENKYDMNDLQWDLIVKQKALHMIMATLSFLIQEDIDFVIKEYPELVKESDKNEH